MRTHGEFVATWRALLRQIRLSPSRALLLVQLLALVLYPLFDGHRAGEIGASVISVGVLGVAVWMVDRSPRQAWFSVVLSITGVLLWVLHHATGAQAAGIAGALFYAAAYLYAAVALVGYMMADEQTSTDELWAAGATFMLLVEGYAWLFMALQLHLPGSMSPPLGSSGPMRSWMQVLFFASANISATGMSDMAPTNAPTRMLCVVAQWNGVMYLAIVVARLAGMLKPGKTPPSPR